MIRRPPRSTLLPYTRSSDLVMVPIDRSAAEPQESVGSRHRRRRIASRSEEHTSELQSPWHLVCRLLLANKSMKRVIEQMKTHTSQIQDTPVAAFTSFARARSEAATKAAFFLFSMAVLFFFKGSAPHRHIPSFPTRRFSV